MIHGGVQGNIRGCDLSRSYHGHHATSPIATCVDAPNGHLHMMRDPQNGVAPYYLEKPWAAYFYTFGIFWDLWDWKLGSCYDSTYSKAVMGFSTPTAPPSLDPQDLHRCCSALPLPACWRRDSEHQNDSKWNVSQPGLPCLAFLGDFHPLWHHDPHDWCRTHNEKQCLLLLRAWFTVAPKSLLDQHISQHESINQWMTLETTKTHSTVECNTAHHIAAFIFSWKSLFNRWIYLPINCISQA